MNSSWTGSASLQYSVMCRISQMPITFMLTNHCALMILLSHSLFSVEIRSCVTAVLAQTSWVYIHCILQRVLGSSSGFTQTLFPNACSFVLSSGNAFGYRDEMGRGFVWFSLPAGLNHNLFFPSEAQFNGSIKRIRSLFPVLAIFSASSWQASLKIMAGRSEERKIPSLRSLRPFSLSVGVLSLFWNSADTKRLTLIPEWHSFEPWYYDRRTCNL